MRATGERWDMDTEVVLRAAYLAALAERARIKFAAPKGFKLRVILALVPKGERCPPMAADLPEG